MARGMPSASPTNGFARILNSSRPIMGTELGRRGAGFADGALAQFWLRRRHYRFGADVASWRHRHSTVWTCRREYAKLPNIAREQLGIIAHSGGYLFRAILPGARRWRASGPWWSSPTGLLLSMCSASVSADIP